MRSVIKYDMDWDGCLKCGMPFETLARDTIDVLGSERCRIMVGCVECDFKAQGIGEDWMFANNKLETVVYEFVQANQPGQ